MTTYTITQSQFDILSQATDYEGHYKVLRSLQPDRQRPVAWAIDSAEQEIDSQDAFSWASTLHHTVPLYTHPAPQQKPLTNEQISTIQRSEPAFRTNSCVAFARAIEAAHNIGVKP